MNLLSGFWSDWLLALRKKEKKLPVDQCGFYKIEESLRLLAFLSLPGPCLKVRFLFRLTKRFFCKQSASVVFFICRWRTSCCCPKSKLLILCFSCFCEYFFCLCTRWGRECVVKWRWRSSSRQCWLTNLHCFLSLSLVRRENKKINKIKKCKIKKNPSDSKPRVRTPSFEWIARELKMFFNKKTTYYKKLIWTNVRLIAKNNPTLFSNLAFIKVRF